MPLCTRHAAIFVNTADQINHFVAIHNSGGTPSVFDVFSNVDFACNLQQMMIDIVLARNDASTIDPPDNFDTSRYHRSPKKKSPNSSISKSLPNL